MQVVSEIRPPRTLRIFTDGYNYGRQREHVEFREKLIGQVDTVKRSRSTSQAKLTPTAHSTTILKNVSGAIGPRPHMNSRTEYLSRPLDGLLVLYFLLFFVEPMRSPSQLPRHPTGNLTVFVRSSTRYSRGDRVRSYTRRPRQSDVRKLSGEVRQCWVSMQ